MKKIPIFLIAIICLALSCSDESYYSLEDFASVPKTDVHIHIRSERNTFVEQAIKDNFKLVNIVVDGGGTWKSIKDQFEFAIFQQKAYPEQFKIISSFSVEDFHEPGWSKKALQWIGQSFNRGAIGIKVWKNVGMVLKDTNNVNVMLNDTRFDEIFSYVEREEKVLVGHLGEPLNCWLALEDMTTNNDWSYFKEHPEYHMYLHPELPSYNDQMQARNDRLDKHPHLNFVGAHMASIEWSVDSLGAWLDRYPKATVDLAARMGQVFWQTQQDREKVRQFFIKYQDRVLYATDMGDRGASTPESLTEQMHDTWLRDWKYFVTDEVMMSDLVDGEFQAIHLPKNVIDKIYSQNALRVFANDR